jgi:hypothetical protein
MTQSKPRDLTPEELALIEAPPISRGTAPLRIPPGTQVAVEQLNPGADPHTAASPKDSPPDAGETKATGASTPKAATDRPDSGKRKGK